MVYPFIFQKDDMRNILIDNKIFVATYWSGQKDEKTGQYFEKHLIPIPIDQRYNNEDMMFVSDFIIENIL